MNQIEYQLRIRPWYQRVVRLPKMIYKLNKANPNTPLRDRVSFIWEMILIVMKIQKK